MHFSNFRQIKSIFRIRSNFHLRICPESPGHIGMINVHKFTYVVLMLMNRTFFLFTPVFKLSASQSKWESYCQHVFIKPIEKTLHFNLRYGFLVNSCCQVVGVFITCKLIVFRCIIYCRTIEQDFFQLIFTALDHKAIQILQVKGSK